MAGDTYSLNTTLCWVVQFITVKNNITLWNSNVLLKNKVKDHKYTGWEYSVPLKSKDGKFIMGEKKKIEIWRMHYSEQSEPVITLDLPELENGFDKETVDKPISEVRDAIKALKPGKAPGENVIQNGTLYMNVYINT